MLKIGKKVHPDAIPVARQSLSDVSDKSSGPTNDGCGPLREKIFQMSKVTIQDVRVHISCTPSSTLLQHDNWMQHHL